MWKRQGCNQLQDYCNNSGDDLYQGGSTGVIHLCEGCSQFWPQSSRRCWYLLLLLLLQSRFSHVRLCATPETAAHQAPQSLGFSRQEHWSGLPFPSPMHENEKWKQSCSVVSDSSWSHGLQPTGLLHPWDFPDKSTGVGCHCLLRWYLRFYLCKLPHGRWVWLAALS